MTNIKDLIKSRGIHYFYRIDNLINGKFYYGIRTCYCLPGRDPYMGSGRHLHNAFGFYGIENFKKTILRISPTREDVADLERWIVTEELVKDPMCYNQRVGGDDQDSFYGKVHCIDKFTKKNVAISKEDYYDNLDKYVINSSFRDSVAVYDLLSSRSSAILISSAEYYRDKSRYKSISSRTMEGKSIYVDTSTGSVIFTNGNDPRVLSNEYIPVWQGRKHSEETKNKMSKSHLGKGGSKGQKWVTNGNISIRVKDSEYSNYLNSGFHPGRLIKKKDLKI